MADNAQEIAASEPNELHTTIIDAINKGFTYVSDVLDYCGPREDEQSRGLDSAAYLEEIDKLVAAGYVEREGERFNAQLKLKLTEKGREAAPDISDAEQELIDDYGISLDSLSVLDYVIEHEASEGNLPSISDIQKNDNRNASAYQYTAHFNRLIEAGLASEKGIFRFRIEPTDEGRELVEEYEAHL